MEKPSKLGHSSISSSSFGARKYLDWELLTELCVDKIKYTTNIFRELWRVPLDLSAYFQWLLLIRIFAGNKNLIGTSITCQRDLHRACACCIISIRACWPIKLTFKWRRSCWPTKIKTHGFIVTWSFGTSWNHCSWRGQTHCGLQKLTNPTQIWSKSLTEKEQTFGHIAIWISIKVLVQGEKEMSDVNADQYTGYKPRKKALI